MTKAVKAIDRSEIVKYAKNLRWCLIFTLLNYTITLLFKHQKKAVFLMTAFNKIIANYLLSPGTGGTGGSGGGVGIEDPFFTDPSSKRK